MYFGFYLEKFYVKIIFCIVFSICNWDVGKFTSITIIITVTINFTIIITNLNFVIFHETFESKFHDLFILVFLVAKY